MNRNKLMDKSNMILKNNSHLIKNDRRNRLKESDGGDRDNRESLQAEEIIAILIRNQNMDGFEVAENVRSKKLPDFKFMVNYFTSVVKKPIKDEKELISTIQKSIVKVRSFGLPYDASQFGTEKEKPVTEWYTRYGGESAKIMPKTDVLNLDKHHSVKMKGNIQVLDASQKQVGALCLYTLDKTAERYSDKVINSVQKEINEMQSIVVKLSRIPDQEKYEKFVVDYKKTHPNSNADDVRDAAKKEKLIVPMGDIISGKATLSSDAKKNLELFKTNVNQLNKKIESIFSKINADENFKRVFLTESLSGDFMFGRKNASANSIITWERNFNNLEHLSIATAVDEIISSFVPPAFESKSSGNWGTSVAKLAVDLSKTVQDKMFQVQNRKTSDEPYSPKLESIIKENFKGSRSKTENTMMFIELAENVIESYKRQIVSTKKHLEEGKINEESFFDKVKSVFNKIVNVIKVVGKKIAEYFSDLKDALYGLPSDIFNFFGMEIVTDPSYKVRVRF